MGLQRNVGLFGLLQALEVLGPRNLLGSSPGDPRRNFLGRGLVINRRGNRRSSCSIFWHFFIITTSRDKLYAIRQRKDKYGASAELEKHLRCHEIKKLDTLLKNRGFVSQSSLCRGTRRSKLVDAFPLLVHTNVFGKCRGRQCR
jgi:hypothetical protein